MDHPAAVEHFRPDREFKLYVIAAPLGDPDTDALQRGIIQAEFALPDWIDHIRGARCRRFYFAHESL
ncbi:hypothetical protein N234_26250 [Ralstonia pickettii DTP0602]|nr:hypothetical protein N234_26250 [Ralstonia pickettii DTP0602]